MDAVPMSRAAAGPDEAAFCDGTARINEADKSTSTCCGLPPTPTENAAGLAPARTSVELLLKDTLADADLPASSGAGEMQWPRLQLPHGREDCSYLLFRKAISSHIAGTGTFLVEHTRPLHAPQERPAYLRLPAADQKRMLQDAYEAVVAVCEAMVPGNGLELMDALMEATDVYRKRYGYKKNLFDLDGGHTQGSDGGASAGAAAAPGSTSSGGNPNEEELVRLTPTFQSLGGVFLLKKDRNSRRRRSCFTQLARSQRARVIKATYELIQAVGEEFSPGTRLDLLDRVFEHHTALRTVQKKSHREAPERANLLPQKRVRPNGAHPSPAAAPGPFASADPLVVAAAHVLAAHWARVMGASMAQAPVGGNIILPPPPPLPLPPLPPLQLLQPMMQHLLCGSLAAPLPPPGHFITAAATEVGSSWASSRQLSVAGPATVAEEQGNGDEQPSGSKMVAAIEAAEL